MRKNLFTSLLLSFSLLSISIASYAQSGTDLMLTSILSGANNDADGVASITLNHNRTMMHINVTARNLSGKITAAHLHEAEPGASGPAVFDLTPFSRGNRIIANVPISDVPSNLLGKLLSGRLYLNIHTNANPDGEVRGQMTLAKDWTFVVDLDEDNEVHHVSGTRRGQAIFTLGLNGKTLKVDFEGNRLSGAITAAFLMRGAPGENGSILINLTDYVEKNSISTTLDVTNVELLTEAALAGYTYLNIHTATNPNGETRGQLVLDRNISFEARMTQDQAVMTPVNTIATGLARFSFNGALDSLYYDVALNDVFSTVSRVSVLRGMPGEYGQTLFHIDHSDGERLRGVITGSDITPELVNNFLKEEVYIVLRTRTNQAEEIRGQFQSSSIREPYTYNLRGSNEVPAVTTTATGSGFATLDKAGTNLFYALAVDGLDSPVTFGHFHNGPEGINGVVLHNISPDFERTDNHDFASDFWQTGTFHPLREFDVQEIRREQVYINIHNDDFPDGILRGNLRYGAYNTFHETSTSLETIDAESTFSLFPNPVSGLLNIHLKNTDFELNRITIYDAIGNVIMSEAAVGKEFTIDTQYLTEGIYHVEILGDSARAISRFVKM